MATPAAGYGSGGGLRVGRRVTAVQVRSQININFHAASSVKLYHLIKVPDTHKFYSWQGSPAQKRSTKVQLINYSLITRGHTRGGGMV